MCERENVLCSGNVVPEIWEKFNNMSSENGEVLFAVSADLLLCAQYGNAALFVTKNRMYCIEQGESGGSFSFALNQIEEVKVKRMYGNAVMSVNGTRVLRFSFDKVAVMEAAARAINDIVNGKSVEESVQLVKNAIEKQAYYCKKCGRALQSANAECMHCKNKKKLLPRVWEYVKPQKGRLAFCLVLSAITTALSLVPPYITKNLVDDVIPNAKLNALYSLVLLLVVLHLVSAVINMLRSRQMHKASDTIVTNLRNDIYKKSQYLTVEFYDKTGTGAMFSRISNDTNVLNNFILRISQEAVIQFFLMIGIIVIMIKLNFKLALLALLPIPVVVIISRSFRKRIRPQYHKKWVLWGLVSNHIGDSLPGIRVTKAFTGEKATIEKFEYLNDNWYQQSQKMARLGSVFPHVVGFLATCASLIIWGVGGTWAINYPDDMSVGLLVSFISYASMFYGPVSFFANLSDSYSDAITATEKIFDILDAEPEPDRGKGNTVNDVKGKIEFKHVSFSFDKTAKVLDDVSLTVEAGDIVGIVGTTGAGKTTLINLLMRYYDKYEGQILLDGVDIRDIDLECYRKHIGFVQQEPLMFHDTIFNNLVLSNKNASVEDVIKAAQVANAHGFITRLPDSYDTMLAERGIGVSGGEKQRLSIARAVLKNPSLLIFDEATASVDSETEHLIQDAIEKLISGRTTLMIAHRLSTLRKANKIVVIDKGKIIECGSHEELMALGGKYRKLVEIQNLSEEIREKSTAGNFEGM